MGGQLIANEKENFVRQVSQRHTGTAALQREQGAQQLEGDGVHQCACVFDAAVGANVKRDRQRT
jgi:hypothetical protein